MSELAALLRLELHPHLEVLQRSQAVSNRDYQARMFAGLVLATTSYHFRQDRPLPITAALLELKELTAIPCREALPPSAAQL